MGLCQSEEEKKLHERSKGIGREINESAIESAKAIKLLLLSTGDSGKSTLLMQMRILHSSVFTQDEIIKQRLVVFENTIHAMDDILKVMERCSIKFSEPARKDDSVVIAQAISTESKSITYEIATAIKNLWQDPAIQNIYERRHDHNLHESAKHFFDSIDRITALDYKPSEQDILLTRIKTTGIVEVHFTIKNIPFRVFDVGGQRSERKKCIHYFEDVSAVIYVAAISEYAEVLFEDNTTNRMVESMCLFETICNSRWIAFPHYNGPQTYEDSIAFITKSFEALNTNPEKTIYVHQTYATDTSQVQIILDNVIVMVIEKNLKKVGMF
ncbi:G-protein alpha subunit family protein [Brugia pahangi]